MAATRPALQDQHTKYFVVLKTHTSHQRSLNMDSLHVKLMEACLAQDVAAVENLLQLKACCLFQLGPDQSHVEVREDDMELALCSGSVLPNETALHIAARLGCSDIVKLLLKTPDLQAPDNKINLQSLYGPALTQCQSAEIVDLLLGAKADVHACAPTLDALPCYAAKRGQNDVLSCLIKHNVDVNFRSKLSTLSLLHLAVEAGHATTCAFLISAKADVNAVPMWNQHDTVLDRCMASADVNSSPDCCSIVWQLLDAKAAPVTCSDVAHDAAPRNKLHTALQCSNFNTACEFVKWFRIRMKTNLPGTFESLTSGLCMDGIKEKDSAGKVKLLKMLLQAKADPTYSAELDDKKELKHSVKLLSQATTTQDTTQDVRRHLKDAHSPKLMNLTPSPAKSKLLDKDGPKKRRSLDTD